MKKTVIYKKIESGEEEKYEYENPADEGGKSVDYSDVKADELRIIRYDTGKPGKDLLVFGAVHGHEICGPKTIARVSKEIDSGKIQLESGSITFVPICNPGGYLINSRYVDIDLNRSFSDEDKRDTKEARIANHLKKLINNSTHLLDIHSYSSDGPHFAFYDVINKDLCDFAKAQNFQVIMCNFPGMFKGVDNSSCGYAVRHHIAGVTIESGKHTNPSCLDRAYEALTNSMGFLGISNQKVKIMDDDYYRFIEMKERIVKQKEGHYVKDWTHLDPLKKDEPVVDFDDGTQLKAKKDCLIVLPDKQKIYIGVGWFYFGEEIKEPKIAKNDYGKWQTFDSYNQLKLQEETAMQIESTTRNASAIQNESTTRNASAIQNELENQLINERKSTTKRSFTELDKIPQDKENISNEPSIKKTKLSLVQNANGSSKDTITSTKQKTKELTGP